MFAIDKQQWDVDGRQAFHLAVVVHVHHLVDVRIHLQVFVAVEAADMALVVAFKQRRQVFADGAVDQLTDLFAVGGLQADHAFFQVVEHRFVEQG